MFQLAGVFRKIALLPLLGLTAAGQSPGSHWENVQALAPGTTIRVAAGKAKGISGTLESVTGTMLLISTADLGRQPFERTEIASVSVKKPGHRARNTLIGLGVGLVAGAGLGLAAGECKNGCKPNQSTFDYAIINGGVLGAVIGVVWRTGGWRKVYER